MAALPEGPLEFRAERAGRSPSPMPFFTEMGSEAQIYMHHGDSWSPRGRRARQPTPGFLPGESQSRGSLVGCCLWGLRELDTTEATEQQQQEFQAWESWGGLLLDVDR